MRYLSPTFVMRLELRLADTVEFSHRFVRMIYEQFRLKP